MSSEWNSAKLSEITTKIGSGQTPRGGKDAYKGGDYALIRSQNIYNYGFSAGGLAYIDQTQAEELSNVEVRPRDVLLNITGDSVARCCGVPEWVIPARVNQHVCILRSHPACLDSGFLRYFLVTPSCQGRLLALASGGATRNALTKGMLDSFEITFPPLPEQKAIAHILGTLDDKIELNRKTNETLEAMVKALFKSWFVDFDPVRSKAEGRPTGLPAEISDLFPDSFEDSELGEIPGGWEVAEIDQIVNLKKDSIDPSFTPEELFYHYSIPAFDAGKNPADELGSSIKSQKFLVGEDDLLVSKLNPSTPRVWIPFSSLARRSICSTEFLVCRASTDVGRAFAYCLASSDSIIEVMTGLAGGTSNSHQRIRPGDFLALDCCIGSQKVRSAFSDVVEPLLRKTLAQRIESRSLASARDALLPKLISGEIRIPDAEKMLEEVGI